MRYPAMRYGVIDGHVADRQINTPEEEANGWLPSPHKFRVSSTQEFLHHGHPADKAEALHKRDVRRVALIMGGVSIEDAEKLADEISEVSVEGLLKLNGELKQKLEDAIMDRSAMKNKFDKAYDKAQQEIFALKGKLDKAEKKSAKTEPAASVAPVAIEDQKQ